MWLTSVPYTPVLLETTIKLHSGKVWYKSEMQSFARFRKKKVDKIVDMRFVAM